MMCYTDGEARPQHRHDVEDVRREGRVLVLHHQVAAPCATLSTS